MGSSKKHKDRDREHKHKHKHKEKHHKHSRSDKEERRARRKAAKALNNEEKSADNSQESIDIDYSHGYATSQTWDTNNQSDHERPSQDKDYNDRVGESGLNRTVEDQPSPPKGSENSLSIVETNKLRLKLGLKPLQVDVPGIQDEDGQEGGKRPDVHVPAVNMAETVRTQKIKERTKAVRAKREYETKLSKVKGLGESDSEDENDDALVWVHKNRIKQKERELAALREKILDDMDADFGLTELVNQEFTEEKSRQYSEKDLQGMTVQHSHERFAEGKSVIMTLGDKGILDDEEDVLVNVNMIDDERVDKNLENKKASINYNPYDKGDVDEFGEYKKPALLSKYDEEIKGAKKDSFKLGHEGEMNRRHESEVRKMREELHSTKQSLSMSVPQLANEYYTHEEMEAKFKKKRRLKKKSRRDTVLKADDLLPHPEEPVTQYDTVVKTEPVDSPNMEDNVHAAYTCYSTSGGEVWPGQGIPPLPQVKDESDSDDLMGPSEDLSGVVIDTEAEHELEASLAKTRRLKQSMRFDKSDSKVYKQIKKSSNYGTRAPVETESKNSIVLHTTSEFCRSLGDIPTYGLSGNREEDEDLMDIDGEDNDRMLGDEDGITGWNQVDIDTKAPNIEEEEDNILNDEPIVNKGVGTALSLAVQKGYLEKETAKLISAQQQTKIDVENYSIEDKRYDDLDEKLRKRDRYSGALMEFKEKSGYKPDIKLEYVDDKGNMLNNKEAFRYLSHRFHGKGSGKKKMEKRENKACDDMLLKQMSSIDTPLGTLNLLKEKQKSEKSPFLILTGVSSNKAFMANTITK